MVITIIEKAGTVGDIYNVAINNKLKYRVSGQSVPFMTNFSLYEIKNSNPLLSVFKTTLSLFPKYKIYFNDEKLSTRKEPLIFKTTNYFKNSYQLEYEGDLYKFFVHKKLKYSIFKNDKQVAGFTQDRWNMIDEEGFMMECNNDCSKELFSSFVVILDNIYNNKISTMGGLINANVGVIWEAKEYNNDWKSK